MSDLTIDELTEKLKRVDTDIESLRMSGNSGRKIEILTEYRAYLKDELEFLKREQRENIRKNTR